MVVAKLCMSVSGAERLSGVLKSGD